MTEVLVLEKSGKTMPYMIAGSLEAVEAAVQMDTLEFHVWVSKYIPGQPEHACECWGRGRRGAECARLDSDPHTAQRK